jgi:hypothetical protein
VDFDRTTTAVDLAVQLAPNPAHGAGSSEAARQVRDLLAPVLGIGLDGPVIDVVDIGANPIDGDPPYRRLLDSGQCRSCGANSGW